MIDQTPHTLSSSDVYQVTVQILDRLPLTLRGDQVQVTDLLNVLVFAATFRISINMASQNLEGAPIGATVLGELARQLNDLTSLEKQLNQLLAQVLPKRVGAKGRRVAVDLVQVPYHGTTSTREGSLPRSGQTRNYPLLHLCYRLY